jgi:hypothetical protein
MGVTNQRKESVSKKYRTYLQIIYHFGNKVILMKQLFDYAKAFKLAKHYPEFHGQIQELVDADIVKREPFEALGRKTQLHMLTMRKYGIRFVEGKPNSNSVGAVPKANSNERIVVSIFKNAYILDKIIPRLQKQDIDVSYDNIFGMLAADKSSLLYNKNQGLDYLYEFNDDFLESYFEMDYLKSEIKLMEELRDRKNQGLRIGSKAKEGKGKQKGKVESSIGLGNVLTHLKERYEASSKAEEQNQKNSPMVVIENNKNRKLANYNIDNMLNAYAYISQIKPIHGVLTITALLFDINNKQDVYSMATHIACIYQMFQRYLKSDFNLKVGIIAYDLDAEKNMKEESEKLVKDRITKEPKGKRLDVALQNWKVDREMQKYIEVKITNYDITNRYLEGIKHANLVRK